MAGNIYPDWTPSDYTLSGWLAGEAASDRDWALKKRMGLDNLFRQGEIDAQEIQNSLDRQTQADKIRKMTGEADSAVAKGTMDQFKVPYEKQGIIDADKLNKGVTTLQEMLETLDSTGDINAAHQAAIAAGADPKTLGKLNNRDAIAGALVRWQQRAASSPQHTQKMNEIAEAGRWKLSEQELQTLGNLEQAKILADSRLDVANVRGAGGAGSKEPYKNIIDHLQRKRATVGLTQQEMEVLVNAMEYELAKKAMGAPGLLDKEMASPGEKAKEAMQSLNPQNSQQQPKELVLPDGTKIRRKQ